MSMDHLGWKRFFSSFSISWVRILLLEVPATGRWDERISMTSEFFVLCYWTVECCDPLHHFSVPDPGPNLSVCQPSGLIAVSAPPVCLVRFAPEPFTDIVSTGVMRKIGQCVASITVLSPYSIYPICQPSDVSIHGSLRCVFVLSGDAFVEL